VFENRRLRRIFGPRRDVTGKWTELNDLYSSPNIFGAIQSRRMK
jgi:hypothetical protein